MNHARIFTKKFIDNLLNGQVDAPRNSKKINDIEIARMLYELYAIAPGLNQDENLNFYQFILPEDARWLSYLEDMTSFYKKGPSFEDVDITYLIAKPLLDDFFYRLELAAFRNSNEAMIIRFAHAETIIPLAALMQLSGSDQAVAATNDYTYADNPWRSADISPYAANIQWDVYRNNVGKYLVKMYYNEKEIKFKRDCKTYRDSNYYYDLIELKRCYAAILVHTSNYR